MSAEDADSQTPLHLAGSTDVASQLLAAGAGRCLAGLDPVQHASMHGGLTHWHLVMRSFSEAALAVCDEWPRLLVARQRLAWCRSGLLIGHNTAAADGHAELSGWSLSPDLIELIGELLQRRGADTLVVCKDAQERVTAAASRRQERLAATLSATMGGMGMVRSPRRVVLACGAELPK